MFIAVPVTVYNLQKAKDLAGKCPAEKLIRG